MAVMKEWDIELKKMDPERLLRYSRALDDLQDWDMFCEEFKGVRLLSTIVGIHKTEIVVKRRS